MRLRLLSLGVAFLLLSPVYVFAADQQEIKEVVEQAQAETAKSCPVCGPDEKMEGEGISYEYEGKMYWFCSQECLDEFKKNPEKYNKSSEKEHKHSEEESSHKDDKHEAHNHEEHDYKD